MVELGELVRTFKHLLLAFIISIAGGVVTTVMCPEIGKTLVALLRGSLGGRPHLGTFSMFLMIFLNNSKTAAIAMLGGIVFGIVPWIIVLFNGFMVGSVSTIAYEAGGKGIPQIILLLIPHGVIEIPAILLAATAGILFYRNVRRGYSKEGFKLSLKLLGISVVMLFIAALVETFVTPVLGGIVTGS